MTARALLLLLLLSVSTLAQESGRKPKFAGKVPPANERQVSRRRAPAPQLSLEEQAKETVRQLLENTSLTKCGDSYYSWSNVLDARGITQFNTPFFVIANVYPLTAADKLNGITWKGRVQFRYRASRRYSSRWQNWEDYESLSMFTFPVEKRNTSWRTEAYLMNTMYRKISCTDLPGAPKIPTLDPSHTRSDINPALASYVVLEVKAAGINRNAMINQTIEIMRKRLGLAGVSAYKVERENNSTNRIVVKYSPLNGIKQVRRFQTLISNQMRVEIVHIISPPAPSGVQIYGTQDEAIKSLGGSVPSNRIVLPYLEHEELTASAASVQTRQLGRWVIVAVPAVIDGSDFNECRAINSEQDNYSYINCSLKKTGSDKLGTWTSANINQYIGVVLNREVRSIAYIKSQIRDSVQISGNLSKEFAEDVVIALQSGALPAPIVYYEEGILKSFRKD